MFRALIARAACAAALLLPAIAQAVEGHRVWHEGREIEVVDEAGWALYQGDILIGRMDEVLARSLAGGPDGRRIGSIAKSVTAGSSASRWPRGASGLFEMPYVVESDPDGNVAGAIQLFNDQLAGFMRAVPHTNEPDYVAFTLSALDNGGACSSSVGRVGGRQIIQGSHLCAGGLLVHEMGHAIGLFHEQEHADRDLFVRVDMNAVEPARASNYARSANQRVATPYDFASIMHYASSGFSKLGLPTMETIPPGIAIGQRAGYSPADLEGIRRFYGAAPQLVTVATFPAGLTVLVDGLPTSTPATFSWPIASTHTLDVAANVQVLGGAAHVFARWNIDRNGDLAARRTITVAGGDGSITAPPSTPAVSTYTATFVRYKEVRLTTAGNRAGVGGSVVATPAPATLPGVAGTYYRERQDFTLQPQASAGSVFGVWAGSYLFFPAYTTSYRSPFRGPLAVSDTLTTAFEYRASFVDFPLLQVRARAQDGEALGLRATVARSGSASTDERLPYNGTNWSSAQSGTLTATTGAISPFATTMRYVFQTWDGDPSPTITVASPAAGQGNRIVTANYSKEYQAFKQVIPSCGGTITLPADPSGWYAHGSNVGVVLGLATGWTFAGWEGGSLSGASATPTLAVNDFPNLIARLNTVAAPLAVAAVAPTTLTGGVPVTLTIDGSGFTPATEVYLAGVRQPSQFVAATRLTASVAAADVPATGLALVTVTNRPTPTSGCSVSATGAVDVIGAATADTSPQTGWWWNPNESGRGFFIEKRGGNLFMAGYLYEADGRATWFSASGPVSGSSFSADMTTFRGGQTLTGAYVAPTAGASPGRLTLDVTAPDRATLTWPGGTTALQRFVFGSGGGALGENGWWWNSGESGRGFSIEVQGNAMFMAGFMYDAAGSPIWYVAQGTLASNGFANAWQQFAGGQTLTGPYRGPAVLNSNVGALSLSFASSRAGTLTLPNGRSLPITRFDF